MSRHLIACDTICVNASSDMQWKLYTIGHGKQSAEQLFESLRGAAIERLVDVRAFPRSRTNPQFNRDSFAVTLQERGIAYHWEAALGGRRRGAPDSPNTALRNAAFRAYADYMATLPFWIALDSILGSARAASSAIMCAETVWWRCHRRLIADAAMLVRGFDVFHIMPQGRLVPHTPTAGIRIDGERLIYDVLPQKHEDGSAPSSGNR